MSDKVIVVSAAIVNVQAKRLFVQRRSGDTTYPWHWVTPGGKADTTKILEEELQRELFEEHGVWLKPKHRTTVYEHEIQSTRNGRMMWVTCLYVPHTEVVGTYQALCRNVAGFDWVSADELETLMLGPADAANRDKLLALIR